MKGKQGNQFTLKNIVKTILALALTCCVLYLSLPLPILLLMEISTIPYRIDNHFEEKKTLEVALETEPLQVGDEKIYVDTMQILLYGLKEVKPTDYTQPTEYEYIGCNEYNMGFYEYGAQLRTVIKNDKKYEEDTNVTDFFNKTIQILNDLELDYVDGDFPEEYYIGFDDDTVIEYAMPDGEIRRINYGFEAAMSITFFGPRSLSEENDAIKPVTFRLLLGNPEDSIEYTLGELFKESITDYIHVADYDYRLHDLKSVLPLINSGSWIPPETFGYQWVD